MISCSFFGGLGNNLFQLATVYNIHKKYGFDLKIPTTVSRVGIEQFGQSNKLEFEDLFENIFQYDDNLVNTLTHYGHTDVHLKSYNYTPINVSDNTCYFGYFQSYKYFNDVDISKEFILKSDNISFLKEKYDNIFHKKTISLHFRLGGDRVTQHMQFFHKNLSLDFYKEALKIIDYNEDDYNILIFTDNVPICVTYYLNNLGFKKNIYIIDNNNNNVLDFTLMSMCDINVVSNSTFSWWAAYMNQKQNKKIIVTEKEWFGPGYKHFDLTDTFPKEWIRI
jgi:hypothetical protein